MSEAGGLSRAQREGLAKAVLAECYAEAEALVTGEKGSDLEARLGGLLPAIEELGTLTHAARGVALTLAMYKAVEPGQDVTAHKDEFEGGFSARSIDTSVTIPFLIEHSLPRNVESHWLSQSFSFAAEFREGLVIKTVPKRAGPLVVQVASALQNAGTVDFARAVATGLLVELIKERNKGRVILTRPKGLSIEATVSLLERFLGRDYKHSAPRLPQIVIYAIYQCIVPQIARYNGMSLEPLGRMKSADRKADTVGDVVVTKDNAPVEAVEVKYRQPIAPIHVSEAIEKVRALAVTRYYILSTMPPADADWAEIESQRDSFLKQNGCEIIVNGVLETLSYYLRLLPDTTEFVFNFATILETDEDTNYEHRLAWNECCQEI